MGQDENAERYGEKSQYARDELEEITRVINAALEEPDVAKREFRYPNYGGLAGNIAKKMTVEEMLAIMDELLVPEYRKFTPEQTADILISYYQAHIIEEEAEMRLNDALEFIH